jgi:MscS family membrane protein
MFQITQETVMLDLLRIVGHHKARLATQIRTVQKSYGNADFDNIPFGEDTYSRVRSRPLLIDTSARVSDDKAKPRPVSSHEEQKAKTSSSVEINSASPENTSLSNSEKQEQKKIVPDDARTKNSKSDNVAPATPSSDPVSSTSKTAKGKAHEPEATEGQDGSMSVANPKKESRPAFEDNIVLGVALAGSKRTLPIEEGDPYLSLSETEPDTVEAASSQKDKTAQSPKLSGQEKADQRNIDR